MSALMELSKDIELGNALSRQSEIIPDHIADLRVTVVGVGGIGSNVVWTLAGMGVRYFELFDPDVVNTENIYPGNFSNAHIGTPKVSSVKDKICSELMVARGDVADHPHAFGEYGGLYDRSDIFIVATDNMESRRETWAMAEDLDLYNLWIDARMGGTSATVYSLLAQDDEIKSRYNKRVQIDNIPLPCGQKATALLTKGMIPAMVAQSVYDYVIGRDPIYGQVYDLQSRRTVTFNS